MSIFSIWADALCLMEPSTVSKRCSVYFLRQWWYQEQQQNNNRFKVWHIHATGRSNQIKAYLDIFKLTCQASTLHDVLEEVLWA